MYFENTELCSLIQLCIYYTHRYGICQVSIAVNSQKTVHFFPAISVSKCPMSKYPNGHQLKNEGDTYCKSATQSTRNGT